MEQFNPSSQIHGNIEKSEPQKLRVISGNEDYMETIFISITSFWDKGNKVRWGMRQAGMWQAEVPFSQQQIVIFLVADMNFQVKQEFENSDMKTEDHNDLKRLWIKIKYLNYTLMKKKK